MRPRTMIAFRCRPFVIAACCLAFVVAPDLRAQPAGGLSDVDPAWLDSWQQEVDWQVEQLSAAYALNEDQRQALRTELENRLLLQKSEEDQLMTRLSEQMAAAKESIANNPGEETAETIALTQQLGVLNAQMPLHDLQVAKWVEERVAPSVATEGRQRFEELRQRRQSMRRTADSDRGMASGKKTKLVTESREMNAAISPETERPTPRALLAKQAEQQRRRAMENRKFHPSRPKRRSELGLPPKEMPVPADPGRTAQRAAEAARNAGQPPQPDPREAVDRSKPADPRQQANRPTRSGSRARTAPRAQKSAPPAPAPPLDEWDKFVIATAGRYGFDEQQLTQARSVLAGLRARAVQYQRSRAAEFARLELMEDAKAREAERKALNAPLDALFEELKQRIENLATLEQRHRVEAGGKGKSGR